MQSVHVRFAHVSWQCSHRQAAWLHVEQVQSLQEQSAQRSLHEPHSQCVHSS